MVTKICSQWQRVIGVIGAVESYRATKSQRLAELLSFSREGHIPSFCKINGKHTLIYNLSSFRHWCHCLNMSPPQFSCQHLIVPVMMWRGW